LNGKTIFILSIALIALIAASGCIGGPVTVCGNGICETGETATSCPEDCGPKTGSLEVTVIDSVTAQPIEGARVEAWLGEGPEPIPPVITDSEGIALFREITPGAYLIEATKDGYEQSAPTEEDVKAGQETLVSIELVKKIEFDTISIGDGVLKYTDATSIQRSIPFYIKLYNTMSESVFVVGGQTFYYRCSDYDVNLIVPNNSYLNGQGVTLKQIGPLVEMYTDNGLQLVSTPGRTINFGGVQFTTAGASTNPLRVYLLADGNCQFSKYKFDNAEYLTINGVLPLNNTMYYDDDNANRGPLSAPLYVKNSTLNDIYNYRMYVGRGDSGIEQDGSIYLLLEGQTHSTDHNNLVTFHGTDANPMRNEDGVIDQLYYLPDLVEFSGGSQNDNSFFIAQFYMSDKVGNLTRVMVDTATTDTILMPNPQLSYYTGCVYYDAENVLKQKILKCDGTDMTATTASGSKINVANGVATIQIPVTTAGGGGGSR
jgi:hypothetical protein